MADGSGGADYLTPPSVSHGNYYRSTPAIQAVLAQQAAEQQAAAVAAQAPASAPRRGSSSGGGGSSVGGRLPPPPADAPATANKPPPPPPPPPPAAAATTPAATTGAPVKGKGDNLIPGLIGGAGAAGTLTILANAIKNNKGMSSAQRRAAALTAAVAARNPQAATATAAAAGITPPVNAPAVVAPAPAPTHATTPVPTAPGVIPDSSITEAFEPNKRPDRGIAEAFSPPYPETRELGIQDAFDEAGRLQDQGLGNAFGLRGGPGVTVGGPYSGPHDTSGLPASEILAQRKLNAPTPPRAGSQVTQARARNITATQAPSAVVPYQTPSRSLMSLEGLTDTPYRVVPPTGLLAGPTPMPRVTADVRTAIEGPSEARSLRDTLIMARQKQQAAGKPVPYNPAATPLDPTHADTAAYRAPGEAAAAEAASRASAIRRIGMRLNANAAARAAQTVANAIR